MAIWTLICFAVVVCICLWQSRELRKAYTRTRQLEAKLSFLKMQFNVQYGKHGMAIPHIPLYAERDWSMPRNSLEK